jgi:hypothetical protein
VTLSKSWSVPALSDSARLVKTRRYKQTQLWAWGRQTWLAGLTRASARFYHEMLAWLRVEEGTLPGVTHLAESIALLQTRGLEPISEQTEGEAPIFLFSAGPRAGSTLLQRILVTDPRLLLWGEPLGEMAVVSRIAEIVSYLEQPARLGVWEKTTKEIDVKSSTFAMTWIATLYPSASYFRAALREFVYQWLGKPARESGFSRWGFKEVRLGATEASLLHWLYPNAKFIVICRHPYDCYRSLAHANWVYYERYPDVRINSAARFARHWSRVALSWSELPSGFPFFWIKYEDLIAGKIDFRKLESWLGIEIKENVALSAAVGGTHKRNALTWYQRLIISREAEAGMRALGYSK